MRLSGRIGYIGLYWTVWVRFMQVLYLGRAPHTNETLPDFREKCRFTGHSRVFRGLTGSQRTPGFWGVTILIYGLYKSENIVTLVTIWYIVGFIVSMYYEYRLWAQVVVLLM